MAVPYAILTSMPGLLSRLPRGGRWMELFKQAIGFVLLVIAVKLIGALPEARLMGVLYFSVVLGFCVWMWGSWVSYGMKVSRKIVIRFIAVALAVLAGWSFLRAPAGPAIAWEHYDAELIEKAKGQERPVLIKFTADWCLSCQAAEKMVFSREDIVELIEEKGVLAVKADTTTKDLPATKALKDIYNEPGVPVSILFVPGEKESVRWRGISFADELKSYLEKLPSKN
ncbi:MAG: thioredoxin family protein, partial [Planctomycetota bacterium]|jgi:thiol:disulfide interchange protein DsbD